MEDREQTTITTAVQDVFMTAEEAANFLKITTQSLYQFRSAEKIPYKKIGGKLLFSQKELYEWVMSGAAAK